MCLQNYIPGAHRPTLPYQTERFSKPRGNLHYTKTIMSSENNESTMLLNLHPSQLDLSISLLPWSLLALQPHTHFLQ